MTAPADEVTRTWWDATRDRRLLLQDCGCGHVQHPPRALCTACGSTERLGHRVAVGSGVVDACTVVLRAPDADHEPPYVVARVRLPEGPVLLSNVVTDDPHAVAVGDRLSLTWRALDDGRALPIFTPEETP